MRGLLAAAALVAFLPTAHAQDKGKSDFSANGEFRVRDLWEMNEMGNKDTKPASHNGIKQRFKLGANFKASEKVSAHATLIQAASWGQGSGEFLADRGTSSTENAGHERNMMTVAEAYGNWRVSDDFSLKFGRFIFGIGDRFVISENDWEQAPTSLDGLVANYEAEFGTFQVFGFKYRDFSVDNTISNANSTTSDPQHDAYGLEFDLKNKPAWLTNVNFHLIQDQGDTVWGKTLGGNVATLSNISTLRAGLGVGAAFAGADFYGHYEMVTGKASSADAGTGAVQDANKKDIQQDMAYVQVGYNIPAFMNSRVQVAYARASGQSATDTKLKNYDGYMIDAHSAAGMMQIIGIGNTSYITAAYSLHPMDTTEVGLKYYMYTKTVADGGVSPNYNGIGFVTGGAGNKAGEKNIGNEINLYAEHKYDNNFSTMAYIGQFMPGATFKDDSIKKGDTITQVFLQGKMTF